MTTSQKTFFILKGNWKNKNMKVKALSLKGVLYDGDSSAVNIQTTSGEITIMDHHRPLISVLTDGRAKIHLPAGGIKEIPVKSGFLEVDTTNSVTVLLD